jgi:uncharacterized protein
MTRDDALEYVRANSRGVLATIRRSGQIQMSHIDYTLDDDGLIKIQVTESVAKTKNVRRDPRVALSVIGDDWGTYVVVEGTAGLIEGKDRVPALRHVYERIAGKPHPDWEEFERAMIDEQQVVMTISVERLYPVED